jgi:hypothetical protein
MCRWELDRLHKVLAHFNASIEASRQIAGEPFKTEIRRDEGALRKASLHILRERAEETRTFADEVSDPEVKRLLLELAESYERVASKTAAGPASQPKAEGS